jgi:uncharacterized protein (TIGR03435 family)
MRRILGIGRRRVQRNQGLTLVVVASLTLLLHAQAFDVASIKRNVSGDPRSGARTLPGGRVAITNEPLRQIVRRAYGSNDLEVLGGPDWVDDDRWDITASAGTDKPDVPLEPMLKALLADRFKLRAHVEMRERPIYGLVFARGDRHLGDKIHPTTADCRPDTDCGSTSAKTNGIASGTITSVARTINDIAVSLSRYAGRRVLDRTGLAGRFDADITWSEDVSIFTALQEQFGLKFESQRAPVEVVVVDSVERAAED